MIDNRHSIELPFWARPGFRSMAAKDDGGGDPEFVDADEDDEDDEDGDEGDDPDAGKSDEELRAELKSVRESLTKANGQSKARRLKLKQRENELAEARKPKQKTDDEGDKPDAEAIRASIEAEVNAKANIRTIKAEAKGALRGIGVPADQVASIVNMLTLDDVDVDDDGNVEGIDDAIDDLKTRFPQLFPKSRKKTSVGGGLDRDGKQQPKVKTTSQLQADRLRRG